jgi:hypothetical protein
VLAAAFGQGYAGRHRLAEVALGVEQVQTAPVLPVVTAAPALPTAPMVVGGARLAVVPVPASPDPLVDTMPHPVVKLFPMAVEQIHDAVFADEDAEREDAATIDLAAAGHEVHEYHGRHTA